MTDNTEIYALMSELLRMGREKGRKPRELIDELPADDEKKRQLREVLQYLIEGPQELSGLKWQY